MLSVIEYKSQIVYRGLSDWLSSTLNLLFTPAGFDKRENLSKMFAKRDTSMSQSPISKDRSISMLIIANFIFSLFLKETNCLFI